MNKLEQLSINTIRVLSADVVQKANSGHPGAPMGCAPITHLLFSRHLNFNSKNSNWLNRDRFVLSNGHSCALLYVMLHLTGYKMEMEDLKQFRRLNSITPGHPENTRTDGIEVTTGPLGQGFANSVGLAIASLNLRSLYNKENFQIIDNYTYCLLGDGCMQEGVASEAASLAGHLKLYNLIAIYDDNKIQIDGDTQMAFTEDVQKRFESYGWRVQKIDNGDEDVENLDKAIQMAKAQTDAPSLIIIKTTIGYGAKNAGKEKVHGSPLGTEDIVELKKKFGFDPEQHFYVPSEVYDFWKEISTKGAAKEEQWNKLYSDYKAKYPDLAQELDNRLKGKLGVDLREVLPKHTPADAETATRKASENVLNSFVENVPMVIGGSADLTPSNLTRWKNALDFQNPETSLGDYSGRYLRFGVREHAMAAISNGIHAFGGFIPFCATFLNFIGYALGAVRLSALGHHQVLYVATHDSIGLGEDGPTHQPIEIVAALRALPNMYVFRPADGNETSGSYLAAFENTTGPSLLCLSRQNVPHLKGSSIENTIKGAYILDCDASSSEEAKKLNLVMVSTGTEVSICVDAANILRSSHGLKVRVVSMPCQELFEKQDIKYRNEVFPRDIPVISVEAMSTYGWPRYAHACLGVDTFGESAPYKDVYKYFELTPEDIARKSLRLVEFYKGRSVPHLLEKPIIH